MTDLTSDRAFGLQGVEIVTLIHSTGPGFARVHRSALPSQVPKRGGCVCKLPCCQFLGVVCQWKTVGLFRDLEWEFSLDENPCVLFYGISWKRLSLCFDF